MIDKFNGVIYLIIFIIHFLGFGVYAYQMIINNKNFRAKFEMDETAPPIMRMIGASFLGALLMALYIMFIRPGGVEGTWAFFNLVFLQNLFAFIFAIWSHKKGNLGTNEKTSIEGIIAPGVLTLLSAILCYGLADKIY